MARRRKGRKIDNPAPVQTEDVQAQGLFDIFQLFSKENVEKINKILNSISIEELESGATRITIDVAPKE